MMTWKCLFLTSMFPILLKWNCPSKECAASVTGLEWGYCPSPNPPSTPWELPLPWVLVAAGHTNVLGSVLLDWVLLWGLEKPFLSSREGSWAGGATFGPFSVSALSLPFPSGTFSRDTLRALMWKGWGGRRGLVWVRHTSFHLESPRITHRSSRLCTWGKRIRAWFSYVAVSPRSVGSSVVQWWWAALWGKYWVWNLTLFSSPCPWPHSLICLCLRCLTCSIWVIVEPSSLDCNKD